MYIGGARGRIDAQTETVVVAGTSRAIDRRGNPPNVPWPLTPLRRNVSLRGLYVHYVLSLSASVCVQLARQSWIARPWNSKFAFHNREYPIHFSPYLLWFSVHSLASAVMLQDVPFPMRSPLPYVTLLLQRRTTRLSTRKLLHPVCSFLFVSFLGSEEIVQKRKSVALGLENTVRVIR